MFKGSAINDNEFFEGLEPQTERRPASDVGAARDASADARPCR